MTARRVHDRPDGKVKTWPLSARLHAYRAMHRLPEAAGLPDLHRHGALAREPFAFGSNRPPLVGTKQGG